MGARMVLRDAFSSPLRGIREGIRSAVQSTNSYREANSRLRNSMGQFIPEARRVKEQMKGIETSAKHTGTSVLNLKSAIAAVASGVAVKKGFDWLVQGNADMETYQNTLSVVLKSQQKAADTLKWAQTFAATTPFEIPEVVEATTKLSAYGMQAQRVLGVTGDMASVMGKSLDQAVEAIADAQTGELERLKEFGITKAMIEAQGAKMGTQFVNKSGQITDQKAFNAALFSLMEERYKGGMDLQSTTFKGMLSNASDFIGTMGRELGKPLFDKMKAGLGDLLQWANKLKESGKLDVWMQEIQRYAGYAWRAMTKAGDIIVKIFKGVSRGVQDAIKWIREVFDSISKQGGGKAMQTAKTMGERLVQSFKDFKEAAQPVIDWLVETGFPKMKDFLVEIGTAVVDVAAFFTENWSTIKPFIEGIVISLGTFLAVSKAIALAKKVWIAVQTALNIVLAANPIGLIIVGIGLLIGAVILLVRNWDKVKVWLTKIWTSIKNACVKAWNSILDFFKEWGTAFWNSITSTINKVKEWMASIWQGIKDGASQAWNFVKDSAVGAWNGIVDGVSSMWTRIKDGFAKGVNWITGLINKLIDKLNDALSIKLPVWMGGHSFELNIPHIPEIPTSDGKHATGLSRVPFDGYRAELHEGERVLTKAQSNRYDTALGFQQPVAAQSSGGVKIEQLVGKIEVHAAPGDDADDLYKKFIDKLYREAKEKSGILSAAGMGALL